MFEEFASVVAKRRNQLRTLGLSQATNAKSTRAIAEKNLLTQEKRAREEEGCGFEREYDELKERLRKPRSAFSSSSSKSKLRLTGPLAYVKIQERARNLLYKMMDSVGKKVMLGYLSFRNEGNNSMITALNAKQQAARAHGCEKMKERLLAGYSEKMLRLTEMQTKVRRDKEEEREKEKGRSSFGKTQ